MSAIRRRPLFGLALGIAVALGHGAARAQVGAEAPAPAIEARDLGRRLAEAGDFNAIIGSLGAAEIERIAREAPDLSDADRERLRATGRRVLDEERARMIDSVGEIYALRFGLAPLREIVAFFESPSGRTYTATLPALLPDIATVMQQRDFPSEVRATFCRETRLWCPQPAR